MLAEFLTGAPITVRLHNEDARMRATLNNCPVVIDVGGGWGAEAVGALERNGIPVVPYRGLTPSVTTSRDGGLKFYNRRAADWWRMREELDPNQEFGSAVTLAAGRLNQGGPRRATLGNNSGRGIKIEDKEDIKKRLGRSPDDGDAIVMALAPGARARACQSTEQRRQSRQKQATVGYREIKKRLWG